jgi:acyl transferase domain-containing protein/NAD(P)-dependent dehydrogenase (short-subunit alcohol dehydrogenase family)/acyl carrier protein
MGALDVGPLLDAEQSGAALRELIRLGGDRVGLRIEASADFETAVELMSDLPGDGGFVLLAPSLTSIPENPPVGLITTARERRLEILVEVTSIVEAEIAVAGEVDGLVAKGNEAGGRVGEETTFVLLQRLLSRFDLPVWARGGIGVHTAGACAAAGAAGIVLGDELALVRESTLPGPVKTAIAGMDGGETAVLGAHLGPGLRIYPRPGSVAAGKLRTYSQELAAAAGREGWTALVEGTSSDPEKNPIGWSDHQVWPLGQDACFAKPLADRYHTTGGVVTGLLAAAEEHLRIARSEKALASDSPLARAHGTTYPVVQGPMTRVSDIAQFAAEVSAAGGLPFTALALLRAPEVENLLRETQDLLGDRPWGVGILGFVPKELREEQLEVVRAVHPRFALIAGGRPDQAKALEAEGIASYLHVPSPKLLELFLDQGARRFVFEGRECGGHVGPRSSFVLWEQMVEVLAERTNGGGMEDCHVLFAGGIHDPRSAAMVAALAAPLSANGAKIGVLMGTAYLFTAEAVATGAIVPGFQQIAVGCERTVLLESGPGHATRCAMTPFADTFLTAKARLSEEERPEDEVRRILEGMNLGKLRVAAKGLDRESPSTGGGPELVAVDPERQAREGLYMIGQVAGLRDDVVTMADLHRGVSDGAVEWLAKISLDRPSVEVPPAPPLDAAIVGMACLLPGAGDVATFWDNVLNGVDAVTEVPPERFDWHAYFDEDRASRDKIYSRWGGFLDEIPFDPLAYGMPPTTLYSIEPLHLLTLEVVRAALADARLLDREFPRQRTSVILGAGGGVADLGNRYAVRATLPTVADHVPEEIWDRLPEWTEDSFAGLLLNVAAGRTANRFDLGGLNLTVDAACASSLAAIYVAAQELADGRSDLVLAGGIDTAQNPFGYLCFSKTHALSPRGKPCVFDESADGIVISEGLAVVVMKRLADAERDGDRIYAVLRGVGGSSDGRGRSMTAPRPDGQMRALDRAYRQAGYSPATVGLIEAHGTGTAAGDVAEAETLRRVLEAAGAPPSSTAVGSVKSMIGHTKCAAGITGMVKSALALHRKVLPPTLHVDRPNPKAGFGEGPLYVNTELRPWISGEADHPRRAGVSAFGFGGTNFHVTLEEYTGDPQGLAQPATARVWPTELLIFRGDRTVVVDQIDRLAGDLSAGARPAMRDLALSCWKRAKRTPSGITVTLVATDLESLPGRLAALKEAVEKGQAVCDPAGAWYCAEPLGGDNSIAFLFPGQGSQYPDMLRDLAVHFRPVREEIERAESALADSLEQPLGKFIYPPPGFTPEERERRAAELTNTRVAQPALGAVELASASLLAQLGVAPDMVAGHSYGEYTALAVAGVFSPENLARVSEARGRHILEAATRELGSMAAVTADADAVTEAISGLDEVWVANLNAPQQTVISGTEESIETAVGRLEEKGIRAKKIPVGCGFHSPLVATARDLVAQMLAEAPMAPPQLPVYSNSTGTKHPDDPEKIRKLLSDHLVTPVRFAEEVAAMHDAGARIFVEVGPRAVLTGLAGQILEGKSHFALSLDRPGRHGLTQLQHLLGALAAHDVAVDLDPLFSGRDARSLDLDHLAEECSEKPLPPSTWMVHGGGIRPLGEEVAPQPPVSLARSQVAAPADTSGHATAEHGPPPMSVPRAGTVPTPPTGPSAASGDIERVLHQFQATMHRMLESQERVMLAYLGAAPDAVPSEDAAGFSFSPEVPSIAPDFADPSPPAAEIVQLGTQDAADESAATEAASEASAVESRLGEAEVCSLLVDIVVERTGYPADLVDPEASLEADLGIDSIKRVEILGELQRLLPAGLDQHLQGVMEELTAAPSIAAIAARVAGALDSVQTASPIHGEALSDAGPPPELADVPSETELCERLVAIVAERTGYPVELVDPEASLEADLGIDSIKRVEILGAYLEAFPAALGEGLQTSMEALVSAKTLADISRLTAEIAAGLEPTASTSPVDVKPRPEGEAGSAEKSTAQTEGVPRFVVNATEAPLNEPAIELFRSSKVLLVFEDEGGLGNSLCERLEERGQRWVRVRQHASVERLADSVWGVDLADGGQIHELVESIRAEHGPLAGVLFLSPLEAVTAEEIELDSAAWKRRTDREVKALFRVAQAVAPDLAEVGDGECACLVATTAMGGRFGIDPQSTGPVFPGQAGIAGLVKTLALEWPEVRCRAIDLAADQPAEERALAVLAELDGSDSEVEVGHAANRRWVLRPRLSVSPPGATPIAPLSEESVVLVTGGARGITAQVALELAARYRPTLALLGRSPEPPETESPETAGIESESELKQILFARLRQAGGEVSPVDLERAFGRLIAEREIRRNLVDLRALAAEVVYLEADVLDKDSVTNACATLRSRFGRIDALIHGAGIIEDKLLADKDPESFDRVFDTKVTGLLHLLDALRSDSLELVVLFASVAGRFGNRGQCDYAAANEVMNRLAAQLDRDRAARVISINWGPWGQTGMASSEVQRRFAERGVQLIGPEGGRAAFAEMLETGPREEVEVILGDGPWRRAVAVDDRSGEVDLPLVTQPGVPSNGHTEWTCILDPSQDLYLDDHRLDGNPVLPAAVALEYIVEAVQKDCPGWQIVAVRDFQVLSGVVLENGPKPIRLATQTVDVVSQNTSHMEVSVKLLDGDTGRHCYGARVDLSTSRTATPNAATEPLSNLQAFPMSVENAYERWLFHGPVFQTIEEIQGVTQDVIVGVLKPSSPQSCLACASAGKWLVDPVIVDGAFQLTLLFARLQTDMTPLPARFGILRLYSELTGSDVRCVIRARFSVGGQHLETDTTFLSPRGEVIGVLENAEFTSSPALNRLGGQWRESLSV